LLLRLEANEQPDRTQRNGENDDVHGHFAIGTFLHASSPTDLQRKEYMY
jgi:hypothetical protein